MKAKQFYQNDTKKKLVIDKKILFKFFNKASGAS